MSKTRPNKESLLKSLKNGILSRAFLPQEIPNVAKAVNARAPKVINKKTPGPMYKRKPSGKKTNNKRQNLPRTTKKALGGKILMFQNEGVILKQSKLNMPWNKWLESYRKKKEAKESFETWMREDFNPSLRRSTP